MAAGALVTGAGRGLGRALAAALAARGLAVHVTDLDGAAARQVADELGPPAWASALDVRDPAACRAAARATADRADGLAVWVNNAGILRTGPVWAAADDERTAMLAVNAAGLMNGTLAALEPMRAAGRGHVLNIVSLAGLIAAPGEGIYAASKHAAMAFTLGAQLDLRRAGHRDVRVSAICPDGIWTPMLHDKLDDPEAAVSFSGRLLAAEDVARAAVGLLDRPRPLLILPRWRGPLLRFGDAFPSVTLRLLPLVLADARARQRRHARRLRRG